MIRALLLFGSTILAVLGVFVVRPAIGEGGGPLPLTTVGFVDLGRYAGLWYEIARIPNRFQRKCICCTHAGYSLRDDGRIDVVNRCIDKKGKPIEARGIARVTDTQSNARLKVSFVQILGISLFWGDYWIIGLGEHYEYAIVGNPTRAYGWILSREPGLSPEKVEQAFSQLRDRGYDPADFESTVQSQGPPPTQAR